MAERYTEGHWYIDPAYRALRHVRAGYYEESAFLPEDATDVLIDDRDIPSLVEALDKLGYILPRLDTRLREEDLKITHRLLDIIEQQKDL